MRVKKCKPRCGSGSLSKTPFFSKKSGGFFDSEQENEEPLFFSPQNDLRSPRFSGDIKLEAAFDNIILIKIGSQGAHVSKLQQALIDSGHALPIHGVDGIFGSETATAIRNYQASNQLLIDAIVGPETMGHLDEKFFNKPEKPAVPNICPEENSTNTLVTSQNLVPNSSSDPNTSLNNVTICQSLPTCLGGSLPSNKTGPLVSKGHIVKPKLNVTAMDLSVDPSGKVLFCPDPADHLSVTSIEDKNGKSVDSASSGDNLFLKFTVCDGPNKEKIGKIQQRFVTNSIKGKFTPNDNFPGRSLDHLGVGENVFLSDNSNINCDQAGIKWEVQRGTASQLSQLPGNSFARFIAGHKAERVELVLKDIATGTILDTKSFEILKPDNTSFIRQIPGTKVAHRKGQPSAGFLGHVFLQPAKVSFNFIQMREQSAPAIKNGYWSDAPKKVVDDHPVGTWRDFETGDSTDGTKLAGGDEVTSGAFKNEKGVSKGDWRWEIPWEFRVKGGAAVTKFLTAEQLTETASNGDTEISKQGESKSATLFSDSSGFR